MSIRYCRSWLARPLQDGANLREALNLKSGDLAEVELEGARIVITPKKSVEDKALQELRAVLKKVHAENKEVSEEEVVKYATQAIAELREEEYAAQKKA